MIEKIEGIIISEKSYSETSKILKIITKEHGIIDAIAKGAKSLKSPLRSLSTKLTHAKFNIRYKENKLSIITEIDAINFYKNIKTDIKKISYASYILDLTSQVLKQSDEIEIYENLVKALNKIEDNIDPEIITNIIELKSLDYLGVMPTLDSCVKCGNEKIMTISTELSGYICSNCITNEKIIDEKTLKLIKILYYIDINKISNIELNNKIKEELNLFINEYYEKYTGLYLKSKEILKKILKKGEIC